MSNTHTKRRHRSMLLLFGLFFVIVAGLSFQIYQKMRSSLESHLKNSLKHTTAIAARGFYDYADEIEAIDGQEDMSTPVYEKLVQNLKDIRQGDQNVRYAYIMRRTNDPMTLEFVVDADSLSSEYELDRNRNGMIDANEEPSFPGDTYDVSDVPAMRDGAFIAPTTDQSFSKDMWGEWMSGYAPIRDADGDVVAILGLDIEAEEFRSIINSIMPYMYLLIAFVFLFCIISSVALFSVMSGMDLANDLAEEMKGRFHEVSLLLESIVKNLPVALFCKDVKDEYKFILWNDKSEATFGLPREKVIGKNDYDFFPKEQADYFRKTDEDVMKGGKVVDIPKEAVGPEGKKVDVHTIKVPINDEQGNPRYLLGISEEPC